MTYLYRCRTGMELIMKKSIAIFLFMMIILTSLSALSNTMADPVFDSATGTLSTQKKVTIKLYTYTVFPIISLTECVVQKKNGSTWQDIATYSYTNYYGTNTASYQKTINFSSDITTSGEYRIKFTGEANNHSITRYSNSRIF